MKHSSSALLVAALCSAGCALSLPARAATIVIHAGHLIAEPGKPAELNQSIMIEDGKIVAVRDGFVAGDQVIDLKASWVIPGLIDMHTHVTDVLNPAYPAEGQIALAHLRPPAEMVLNMLPRMKTLLSSGFTTVRNLYDPSSTTYALRNAINSGIVPGPRMYAIEPQIEMDGGDLDPSRSDVREELYQYVANRGSCTGVVDCTRVVREEIRRGADVIKLRQAFTGGTDADGVVESAEEVRAIINTAHQLNRKVAAHVSGTPAYLHMVIEAGADTIEHGPLDDASIALMKKHGTAYTPTLLAAKLIDYRFDEASAGTGRAYRAGVSIVFGTDLGIFGPERIHEEFDLLAAAGIPPAQVLRAATLNAAAALGRGNELGSIAPGKIADVVGLKVDPITHIGELGNEDTVTFVMKAGLVFKDLR